MPTRFRNSVCFALFFSCWVGGALLAQSTQLHFQHFTTDDGLPSSETYTLLEDSAGYLWVGTDNGVARFDGYSFEVFDSNDGLEDVVVFTLVADPTGKIWAGTYSGNLYYFEGDRFHPYQYNQIIHAGRQDNEFVHLIDVHSQDSVIVRMRDSGLYGINSQGEMNPLSIGGPDDIVFYTPTCTGPGARQVAPIARNYRKELRERFDRMTRPYEVWTGNGHCSRPVGTVTMPISKRNLWPLKYFTIVEKANGREKMFFFFANHFVVADEGKTTISEKIFNARINFVEPISDHAFWLGVQGGGGLQYLTLDAENNLERVDTFLQGRSISSIKRDHRGGLWVTTLDAGIFYCSFPNQEKYRFNPNARPLAVEVYGPHSFYVGYSDGSLYQYDGENQQSVKLRVSGIFGGRHEYLLYDSLSGKLFTSQVILTHQREVDPKEGQRTVKSYFKPGKPSFRGIANMTLSRSLGPRKALCSNTVQFGILDMDTQETDFLSEGFQSFYGIHAFFIDSLNRYLLGTLNGLMEYHPEHPDTFSPLWHQEVAEFSTRIVRIEEYRKGLLFATRGEGVILLKGDEKLVFKEKGGLASDMVRDVAISDTGDIWVATLAGLSKISLAGPEPLIRTYRTENGLISNEVIDVDIYDEEIWLATNAGIQKFSELPQVVASPSPIISHFIVDTLTVAERTDVTIPAGKHNIEIVFGTINFRLGNQVNYRYRLEADGAWRYTADRHVTFPRLGSGEFDFAVASQNENGVWSVPTELSFRIATPWFATIWALIAGVLLLLGLTVLFFLRRERKRKRENEVQLQITKLEHEALHAQMNPHFVFNVLNSIQNFVLRNEPKKAATYLSRFSLVVRQTLKSSVKGRHTLSQEIEMLETYLMLEKLRFKEGFSYELMASADLPVDDIVLPPLLIQPFVENAILHGLKEKVGAGTIAVRFKGDRARLMVEIEDNGRGFDTSSKPGQESLGMTITRRRLRMLRRSEKNVGAMKAETLYAPGGEVEGTRIVLWIPLDPLATK